MKITRCLLILLMVSAAHAQAAQAQTAQAQTAQAQTARSRDARTAASHESKVVPLSVDRPLTSLVSSLVADDPQIRDHARETLMLLRRDDLPDLLTAARESQPLSTQQIASLEEIVQHVYLTGIHKFRDTASGGFLGISPADVESAVVGGRTMGFDAFRVLREGDAIVGLQLRDQDMQPVANFTDLRRIVATATGGDWMLVRLIRNGQPLEVTLHLAGRDDEKFNLRVPGAALNENPYHQQASRYWKDTFLPSLKEPSTRPAS